MLAVHPFNPIYEIRNINCAHPSSNFFYLEHPSLTVRRKNEDEREKTRPWPGKDFLSDSENSRKNLKYSSNLNIFEGMAHQSII